MVYDPAYDSMITLLIRSALWKLGSYCRPLLDLQKIALALPSGAGIIIVAPNHKKARQHECGCPGVATGENWKRIGTCGK